MLKLLFCPVLPFEEAGLKPNFPDVGRLLCFSMAPVQT